MYEFELKINKELIKKGHEVYGNVYHKIDLSLEQRNFFVYFVAYFSRQFNLKTGVSKCMRDNEFMVILKGNNKKIFDLDQNGMITDVNIIACFEAFKEVFKKSEINI